MSSHRWFVSAFLSAVLAVGTLAILERRPDAAEAAAVLPAGFQEQIVYSGLNLPMNVEFAPDGRVFVAEKAGRVLVYDNLADTTPTTFANLATNVHNLNDRGLLGLAIHPQFPAKPWVYVLYTYDAPPGQSAPVWNDNCNDVGGATGGRCLVTARLSRLQAAGNVMTGSEQVLLSGWCQQFPSHSVGEVRFGTDGMLYVSGGDGSSYYHVDYGQLGTPANPCGDPANEGGSLRSQDLRSAADPTGLNGTILRLDPETGLAAPGNPLATSGDANARRIIAQGMRNPYRFALRPGTNEVWFGDVGWNDWEEINRIPDPLTGVTNFGWPCYEGAGRQGGYDAANIPLCESFYTAGGATAPYYAYHHGAAVVPGEACPSGGSSISGMQFYPNDGPYPAPYRGALFFADYTRGCIWAMLPTASSGGLPDPASRLTFASGAATPVDLAVGPGGELYYVDIAGGTIRRVRHFAANQPPVATAVATPTSGPAPLAVAFDGSTSSDVDPADQGRLRYEWDFTSDGTVDATTAKPAFTYQAGTYTARLTVYDTLGESGTDTVTIQSGNGAPSAFIDSPTAALTWRVGDLITFTGHATDPQQGTLPASALRWRLLQHHCFSAENCHIHTYQEWNGVASASFSAPDHEYPSHLELVLSATDASGLVHTTSIRLNPRTVALTFTSSPPGLQVAVGSTAQVTPFTRTVIQGSGNSVSAVTPQVVSGTTYNFANWSDGGAQNHVVQAPLTPATYTASFASATRVPRANLRVRAYDSQETAGENGRATNAIDGSKTTFWHTRWSGASPPRHPHYIDLDLGATYAVTTLFYLPRQNIDYGRIAAYEVYTSTDGTNWGTAVASGRFVNSIAEQAAAFTPRPARYIRLRALGEVNGRAWTTVAELGVGVIARLPQSTVKVRSVDSQETVGEDGRAVNVLDGNRATFWHTQWQGAAPPHPHQIELDLGTTRTVSCLYVLPRQNFYYGRITGYEVYTSTDGTNWGTPAAAGTWADGTAEQSACFNPRPARYVRLRALGGVGSHPWTTAAEMNIAGV